MTDVGLVDNVLPSGGGGGGGGGGALLLLLLLLLLLDGSRVGVCFFWFL